MSDNSRTDGIRVAIDVGGTFTDIAMHDMAEGSLVFAKVPTTPSAPADGVLAAFRKAGSELARTKYFAHGTTLGLNALLTRTGSRTAIVTTKGFRDVYLLGRTDRPVSYDFRYRKPSSLVERELIFEVTERMNADGNVLEELDTVSAEAAARAIRDNDVKSVAICFLHSYANEQHERMMKEVIQNIAPNVSVSCSYELIKEYREFERTSTTVIDAYIRPNVSKYIDFLSQSLASSGFEGQFYLLRSDGGAMPASRAKDSAASLVLSGPAGGALGAAEFGKYIGERNIVGFDMGGTSTDASLIVDGEPLVYQEASFESLPIMLPSLRISTIGAGGGSILWVDPGGHLQVGPQSAGAVPGPVAYARGGTEPTITDAAAVIGLLGPDTALGGDMHLDVAAARRSVDRLTSALGMDSTDDVAVGALKLAVIKTVGAIRSITVELGYRPSDFALLAFGGAGGLFAADVARELDARRVIIPPGAGSFSAFGMLMSNVESHRSRTRVTDLATAEPRALEKSYEELEDELSVLLEGEGFSAENIRLTRTAEMRYHGQEHSVSVPVGRPIDAAQLKEVAGLFNVAHEARYGHSLDDPAEIVTIRVRGEGLIDKPSLPSAVKSKAGNTAASVGAREVHRDAGEDLPYAVYDRQSLKPGDRIEGPAIVEEVTGTSVIHQGDKLEVGAFGELVCQIGRS